MKRPRFGLRLLLLITTLLAIWFAWFDVKCEQRSAEWERVTFDLRRRVDELESQRATIEGRFKDADPSDQRMQMRKRDELTGLDMRIKDLQQQIEAIKKCAAQRVLRRVSRLRKASGER